MNFMKAMNRHCSVEEYLTFFAPGAMVSFEDFGSAPAYSMAEEMAKILASFKDFKLSYCVVKDINPGTCGFSRE
jgi:hypothetical protein